MRASYWQRMANALPRHRVHEGKLWEVIGCFVSSVFDQTITDFVDRPAKSCIKGGGGRYKFPADDPKLGREVLAALLDRSDFPSRQSKGSVISMGVVCELALRRRGGTALRTRCYLSLQQEANA